VNTEPLPGALTTVTSPPIMRASLRVIASPRPVPPNRCARRRLGLGKFFEQLRLLLRRHADPPVGDRKLDPLASIGRPYYSKEFPVSRIAVPSRPTSISPVLLSL
jgi:hypothetical protein